MTFLTSIDVAAALAGLVLSFLVLMFPRFGAGSGSLCLFLVPGVLVSAALSVGRLFPGFLPEGRAVPALAFLILCSAGGYFASYTSGRADYRFQIRKRVVAGAIVVAGPLLAALPYLLPQRDSVLLENTTADWYGYCTALYLLLTSVLALGSIEHTFRGVEDHVRWELKFLLVGMSSTFGAIVYVASTVLLYPSRYAALSTQAVVIFPIIFLFSCGLIFQSWRRSTGRNRIVVSQGVIYGTITLVSVGTYLLVAGLAARWASDLKLTGIPAAPFVFIVLMAALLTIVSGTAFRHRMKRWVRQNVFVGRYDYRHFWMEASEHVRSLDGATAPGDEVAALIQRALGAVEITVWLRQRNPDELHLVAARGFGANELSSQMNGLVRSLDGLIQPLSVSEWKERTLPEWPDDVLHRSKAALIVPLVSANRTVGVLTVGADRSGKPFDWETREFLRVLAAHFASEIHKAELLSRMVESREAETLQNFSTFLLHDLKNYAATLSLIASNAGRHHANPAFQQDSFQSIVDISDKIKRMCNSLRTFSASLAANKEWHDLNEIVRSVVHSLQTGTGRPIEVDLAALPPLLIDREEMVRLLHNLVLNAHEASGAGGRIHVSTVSGERCVVLSVVDEGKGMSEHFLKEGLFQPFHTTKPDGLGIGLFHSRKIVEAHFGTIEVNSKLGKGTTIRVNLPRPNGNAHPADLEMQPAMAPHTK